jgi:hypothetical protein
MCHSCRLSACAKVVMLGLNSTAVMYCDYRDSIYRFSCVVFRESM